MAPRRPTSSQNSQANDDVPPPVEGLPPMNAKGIYRYLGTLAGLVECQPRASRNNGNRQSSSSRGWVLLIFLACQIQQRQSLGFLR